MLFAGLGEDVELVVRDVSDTQSRPLSVNQSCFVVGFQSKPTVLRTPRAITSTFLPSRSIRRIWAWVSGGMVMLPGAPIGT